MKRLSPKSKAKLQSAIYQLNEVSMELLDSRPFAAWMIDSVATGLAQLMTRRWDLFELPLPNESLALIRSLVPGKSTVRWSGSGTLYIEESRPIQQPEKPSGSA